MWRTLAPLFHQIRPSICVSHVYLESYNHPMLSQRQGKVGIIGTLATMGQLERYWWFYCISGQYEFQCRIKSKWFELSPCSRCPNDELQVADLTFKLSKKLNFSISILVLKSVSMYSDTSINEDLTLQRWMVGSNGSEISILREQIIEHKLRTLASSILLGK